MTQINEIVEKVTENIIERSKVSRDAYLHRMKSAASQGVKRHDLACSNLAHVCAASSAKEKSNLIKKGASNIGIITAYNDMLSAHQPFKHYPDFIKEQALSLGATAQVAGGVPAMCDGVTQGQDGMELSLFSREVIALSTAVALSHQCFDAVVYLGVCDKIIPGMVMAAASFGHLPAIMIPAGPMPSGIPNEVKAKVREQFAMQQVGVEDLLKSEMGAYHSPGTCTFYGTANTNQLLMEVIGLHLPGTSFINPEDPLRKPLTRAAVIELLNSVYESNRYRPTYEILAEKNFVNAIVSLLASGGSTNLVLHLTAMARVAGIHIKLQDFAQLSKVVPVLYKIYPNGRHDVNKLQQAGGVPVFIEELLSKGYLHNEVKSVVGESLSDYCLAPKLSEGNKLNWGQPTKGDIASEVLATVDQPFSSTGGLQVLEGNLGTAIMKTSALKDSQVTIRAPARVFTNQQQVKDAYEAGELHCDFVCVLAQQGPQANGMPELHALTPILATLQDAGHQVALLTDGRMSGASGKIPAAIHVSPESVDAGPIGLIADGDMICLDTINGTMMVENSDFADRIHSEITTEDQHGCGRELFSLFRENAGSATQGASIFFHKY